MSPRRDGRSLGKRLALAMAAIGAAVAMAVSSAQALVAYRSGQLRLEDELDRNVDHYVAAVSEALWIFDEKLLRALLDGMVRSPELSWASVSDRSGVELGAGEKPSTERWLKVIPLNYPVRGVLSPIGELRLAGDEAAAKRAAMETLTVSLPISLAAILFLSLIVYFMLSREVSKPLAEAAALIGALEPEEPAGELSLARPRRGDEIDALVAAFGDMTARLKSAFGKRLEAEAGLEQALADRELLIRELHHRTRNNMQTLVALLALEKSRISDEAAVAAFEAIESRMASMALVHRFLYASEDLSAINLADYVRARVEEALDDGRGGAVAVEYELDDLRVSIDVAVPFGIILGELVELERRHVFSGGRGGWMRILLSDRGGGKVELVVEDDGSDSPRLEACEDGDGLSYDLLHSLAEGQLGGSLECSAIPAGGFRNTLRFALAGPKARV